MPLALELDDSESNMNDNFENIVGALELSDEELMMIQGGGWFDDAVSWTKNAVKDAGKAISSAAKDTWKAVTSKKGKETIGTIGSIASVVGSIIGLL
ncbi:MAG: hypothetical protein ABI895_40020 [Deltaproteobacteria bacterium]